MPGRLLSRLERRLLSVAGPLLRRWAIADRETRRLVERLGVTLVRHGPYNSLPTIAEIEASSEDPADPPYLSPEIFDTAFLAATLEDLLPYAAEFDPPQTGDEQTCERFFWGNSQFSYSDAMSYYCLLRRLRPRKVVEVGAGFSTLVALEALARNGVGSVVCVDPFPRPFLLSRSDVRLVIARVQTLDAGFFNAELAEGDVLFIDSTHTVKAGSDCLHLYLRVLPRLESRLYVHAHDVFLPYSFPSAWMLDHQLYWTEQYLVMALLIDNQRAKVLFGSAYHNAFNPELLRRLMLGRHPPGGASLWFQYDGTARARQVPLLLVDDE